ncbi:hypothetical protein HC823_02105 [Candidatus Gracilibacteria bacterium]|nr:hypothetical protein [Candidatus Gracilibacteria bacterium]
MEREKISTSSAGKVELSDIVKEVSFLEREYLKNRAYFLLEEDGDTPEEDQRISNQLERVKKLLD